MKIYLKSLILLHESSSFTSQLRQVGRSTRTDNPTVVDRQGLGTDEKAHLPYFAHQTKPEANEKLVEPWMSNNHLMETLRTCYYELP